MEEILTCDLNASSKRKWQKICTTILQEKGNKNLKQYAEKNEIGLFLKEYFTNVRFKRNYMG